MTEAAIHAVLDSYFEGLNTENWSGLESLFANDAELEAPGARRHGAKAVAQYFRDALAPYPEHLDQPGRRLIAGHTATVEIQFLGTMASGAPMVFDAVDVFDVREPDCAITRLTSWYDSHEVRRKLLAGRALGDGDGAARAALKLALGSLRGERAHPLGGVWHGVVPPAVSLPATVIDVDGELRGEQLPADLQGRALLLRGATAADSILLAAATCVAVDGDLRVPGVALSGTEFALAEVAAGDGVLVSSPDADGRAHAVLLH